MSEPAMKELFAHKSDDYSRERRELYKRLPQMKRLRQALLIIIASLVLTLLAYLEGAWLGWAYFISLLFIAVLLSRITLVKLYSTKLFEKLLPRANQLAYLLTPVLKVTGLPERTELRLPASKAELHYQLQRLPSTVLEPHERQRVEDSLLASSKTVGEIMTPKKRVTRISASSTLGPIMLDDLAKTEHGIFPVMGKNDKVVGLLDLAQVGDIDTAKQRQTIREQMSQQVSTVSHDASLVDLAQRFLKAKQYLLVVEKDQEFYGVVTVADLLKHLTGIVKNEDI